MDDSQRGLRQMQPRQAIFLRQNWLNLLLLVLGVLSLGAGLILRAQPELMVRTDVGEYNLGVITYNEIPQRQGADTTAAAAAHFEQALAQTHADSVRALALYNLGTTSGRLVLDAIRDIRQQYMAQREEGVESDENLLRARRELGTALQKLAEAVRIDPAMEDAKYNLELLETERGLPELTGTRYTEGEVDKGY